MNKSNREKKFLDVYSKKGITLISLVITIIVLMILISVATYAGYETIRYTKYMNAKSQMEIMQKQLDSWYKEYNEGNADLLAYGNSVNYLDYTEAFDIAEVQESDLGNYRLFTGEYIQSLGIDGISNNFLISIKNRDIILANGINYQHVTYYTMEQFGIDNISNIEISIEFEVASDNIAASTADIYVYNLVFKDTYNQEVDVNKFLIQYRTEETAYWQTIDNPLEITYNNLKGYSFSVNAASKYYIRVATIDNKIYSEKTLKMDFEEINVGDFVQYDVEYQDVDTAHQFTTANGWRILKATRNSEDTNKFDIKIISTGVPVALNCDKDTIQNFEYDSTTIGNWSGNEEQRREYASSILANESYYNETGTYVVSGLLNNFEWIKFHYNTSSADANRGYFLSINGVHEYVTGTAFIDTNIKNKVESIHNITLQEINEARDLSTYNTTSVATTDAADGLFYLKNLTLIDESFDSFTNNTAYYILSTTNSDASSVGLLYYTGTIMENSSSGIAGLRPVITISGVTMDKDENGIWQIQ